MPNTIGRIRRDEIRPGLVVFLLPHILHEEGATYVGVGTPLNLSGEGHYFLCTACDDTRGCWRSLFSRDNHNRIALDMRGVQGHHKFARNKSHLYPHGYWIISHDTLLAASCADRSMPALRNSVPPTTALAFGDRLP